MGAPNTISNQEFASAQERHRQLTTQATRLEVEVEAAAKQVKALEAEAIAQFGTADLSELTKLLESRQAANEAKKAAFVQDVNKLEAELGALRATFSAN